MSVCPAGAELTTSRVTARCSTNWATSARSSATLAKSSGKIHFPPALLQLLLLAFPHFSKKELHGQTTDDLDESKLSVALIFPRPSLDGCNTREIDVPWKDHWDVLKQGLNHFVPRWREFEWCSLQMFKSLGLSLGGGCWSFDLIGAFVHDKDVLAGSTLQRSYIRILFHALWFLELSRSENWTNQCVTSFLFGLGSSVTVWNILYKWLFKKY